VAIYVVLFVLLVLGLFAVQFHRFSRQAVATAFKIEKGEIARQLAESCLDEAFSRFWTNTEDSSSAEALFLQNRTPDAFAVGIPLAEKRFAEMFPDLAITVRVTAGIVDFQTKDRTKGFSYIPGECVGVFSLQAEVEMKKAGRVQAGCRMIRHHEYKVATLLTNPANRSQHAQNFILDYALFVRQAMDEFSSPAHPDWQRPFNNPSVQLYIKDQAGIAPTRRGKVFFGGTDILTRSQDRPIFINTAETQPHLQKAVPTFPEQPIATLTYSDWEPLMPHIAQQMISKMKDKIKSKDPTMSSGEATSRARGVVEAIKVVFSAKAGPMGLNNPTELEKQALYSIYLASDSDISQLKPPAPGFFFPCCDESLLGDVNYLDSILEGSIRQRFLYVVSFFFDLSDTEAEDSDKEDAKNRKSVSQPIPKENALPEHQTFVQGVKALESAGKSAFPMISYLDGHFSYRQGETYVKRSGSDQASFPSPGNYTRQDGVKIPLANALSLPEFRPYGVFTLRFRTVDAPGWLEWLGMFNSQTGRLIVRGVTRVRAGTLALKRSSTGSIEFSGKGVLIVDDGITISSGITKSSEAAADDFLVLFTQKGNITIETDQPIEAMLIAMGSGGRVIPKQPFKIIGGLAVDTLNDSSWPAGSYSIEYNPSLKTDGNHLYQIIPTPHITFQKVMELTP
jgi:Tfp pilus assembly protein PilX